MSKNPLLSICIPTYNQPNSVRDFFRSISTQLSSDLEIIIRDDSSNDETRVVVEEYASRLPIPIRYFKGEKSSVGGYDKALLFLTKEARGEYLWWYGDDVMAPDAISRIVSLVRAHPSLSFVWLNARDINNEKDPGFDLGGDRFFKDENEIFATNVGLLGFPSATLLKRRHALEGVRGAERFIGTTLTGYYLVLYVITSGGKSYFIQKPCLFSNPKPPGEVRWYDSFLVHGVNYNLIAHAFRAKFERKSFRRGLSDQFGRVWRAVVVERALGLNTGFAAPTPKVVLMTKLYWSYPEFWVALPLFLMPRFILRFSYKLLKFFRGTR